MQMEGVRLVVNKGLSNHFQVSHTVTLSTLGESGYRFGSTYVGSKQTGPTEVFAIFTSLTQTFKMMLTSWTLVYKWSWSWIFFLASSLLWDWGKLFFWFAATAWPTGQKVWPINEDCCHVVVWGLNLHLSEFVSNEKRKKAECVLIHTVVKKRICMTNVCWSKLQENMQML